MSVGGWHDVGAPGIHTSVLVPMSALSRVVGHQMSRQNQPCVYTLNDEQSKNEIKTIPLKIASRRIKLFKTNFQKKYKLYSENRKTLLKEIKEDWRRKDIPVHAWLGRLSAVQTVTVPRLTCRRPAVALPSPLRLQLAALQRPTAGSKTQRERRRPGSTHPGEGAPSWNTRAAQLQNSLRSFSQQGYVEVASG